VPAAAYSQFCVSIVEVQWPERWSNVFQRRRVNPLVGLHDRVFGYVLSRHCVLATPAKAADVVWIMFLGVSEQRVNMLVREEPFSTDHTAEFRPDSNLSFHVRWDRSG
jgi:hypothetical protein